MEGKTHTTVPHGALTPMTQDWFQYRNALPSEPLVSGTVPYIGTYIPWPTLKDFEKGKINRTFIEKRNESFIFEVNSKLASKIHRQMGEELYKLIKIEWYISGPSDFLIQKNYEAIAAVSNQTKLLESKLQNLVQLSDLQQTAARPTNVSSLHHSSPAQPKGVSSYMGGTVNPYTKFATKTEGVTAEYSGPNTWTPSPPPPPPAPSPTPTKTSKTGKTGVLVDVAGVEVSPVINTKIPDDVVETKVVKETTTVRPETAVNTFGQEVSLVKTAKTKVAKTKLINNQFVQETKVAKTKLVDNPFVQETNVAKTKLITPVVVVKETKVSKVKVVQQTTPVVAKVVNNTKQVGKVITPAAKVSATKVSTAKVSTAKVSMAKVSKTKVSKVSKY